MVATDCGEEHEIAAVQMGGYAVMENDRDHPASFRLDVGYDDCTDDSAEAGYVVFYTQSANERLRYRMTPEMARLIGNAFCATAAEAEEEVRRRQKMQVEED